MKEHVEDVYQRLVTEGKPIASHLCQASLERFQRDDRLWPVEAWFAVRVDDDRTAVQHWKFQPDPREPEAGDHPLERRWLMRDCQLQPNSLSAAGECPEDIIRYADPKVELQRILALMWELDTGQKAT